MKSSIIKYVAIGELAVGGAAIPILLSQGSPALQSTRDPYAMLVLTFLVVAMLFVSMRLVLFFIRHFPNQTVRFIVGLVVVLAGLIILMEGFYMAQIYRNWKIYLPYFVTLIFYLLRFYFPVKKIVESGE